MIGIAILLRRCYETIGGQARARGELPTPFCNEIKHDGQKSLGVARCTSQRDSLAICNLVPYKKEFQWKLPNSTIRQDSRCELEGNNRDGEDILEVYGTSSRCFDFKQPWRERKCGRHSCQNGTLYVAVHDSNFYPCYYAGQHVHIRRITEGWLREGIIVCPACDEFCSQCKEHEKTDNYIGDPDLDVPCSSCELLIWVSIGVVLSRAVLGLM
ncbi:hypothetical protein TELCIR_06277 [Teladorsagia circumcincta]|uniref:Uncharacterized protein n=1 Tax=Teladorsagia circumcincta TaxID=45464 RepID=A0A2G9UNG1_TELCI|nr:hypothetical protein TELCIR_06277 [Teladorsagia circumcincta]